MKLEEENSSQPWQGGLGGCGWDFTGSSKLALCRKIEQITWWPLSLHLSDNDVGLCSVLRE